MAPLGEISANARVTRSSTRAQKGPTAPQGKAASSLGRPSKSSAFRKRAPPVEPESDSNFDNDVDADEVEDEESDYEPEELLDEHKPLNWLVAFDEELEEDEPEAEFNDHIRGLG